MSNVFILCAGKAERFGGRAKQLFPISKDGVTTFLGRILKQTKGHNVWVVTQRRDIQEHAVDRGADIIVPENCEKTCFSAWSSREHWGEHNIILLGDVVYSNDAMGKMLACKDEIMFFGNQWEMFSIVFTNKELALKALLGGAECAFGKIRHAYRSFIGVACNRRENHMILKKEPLFFYIDDRVTCDCDSPQAYNNILAEKVNNGLVDKS